MVSFGGIGSTITHALLSWGFWLLIGVAVIFVVFGSLWLRKKGKFIFPAVVIMDNGNGKIGLKFTRAGWFKSKKLLGGLYDYAGEKRLELKDGRIVQQGSTTDFHEIGYKTALIVQEKPDDPKILLPISKVHLDSKGKEVLLSLAPADYRDASSKIISDAEKESLSKWETIAQVLVFGFVAMILFISIILVIQYSKNAMTEANAIHKEALGFYDKVINRVNVQGGSSP